VFDERLVDLEIQRNDPSFSGFALCPSHLDRPVVEVDLALGEGLDLGVPETSVAGQHESWVHMRAARLPGLPGELFALLAVEGFADPLVNGQLELLGLLQLRANQFARVAEHLEKKPDLFIDRLRRGFLAQPVFLIAEHRGIRDVADELCSEKPSHMPRAYSAKVAERHRSR